MRRTYHKTQNIKCITTKNVIIMMATDEENYDFHESVDSLSIILSSKEREGGASSRTDHVKGSSGLPMLPPSVLSHINQFCGRFSKFTVHIDEKDVGLGMNECVNYFLEVVAYNHRWWVRRTWGGADVGHRVVLTFISSSEGEHDVMKWNMLQDELQAVFSRCDVFLF